MNVAGEAQATLCALLRISICTFAPVVVTFFIDGRGDMYEFCAFAKLRFDLYYSFWFHFELPLS